MAPAVWFYLGKLLFNAGKVAMHSYCCCDNPVQTLCCCPGTEIPTTLVATISDKTGDCTCLPDEVILTYLGSSEIDGIMGEWQGDYAECDGGGCAINLKCMRDEDLNCYWELGPASCAAGAVFMSELSSCDPLVLVFDLDNSIGGTTNCTGTFRVTITI